VSTFTWTNTAVGDWSVAADWSSAPILTSDLAITLPGTYTITASLPETAQSLIVDAPGAVLVLDASLTLAGDFTLQAGTLVFAGGTLSVGTFEQDGGLITGGTVDIVAADTVAFYGGTITAQVVDLTEGASIPVSVPVQPDAPCYRNGTRILTDHGEVAVEVLCIGDLVQTVLGDALTPVTWVGRRKVDCARHPNPGKVWPVRIAAGAFGSNRPHTDLFLSPDHAVYVNRVLITIKHLLNGSTITQVPTDQVTYHHLELPTHDVLLAEGLPAESFLDLRDGSNYANRPGPIRLYPDYSVRMWEAFGCARLVVTGPELQAARTLVTGVASARAAA